MNESLRTFSLGLLFRTLTLGCLAIGWLSMVMSARPNAAIVAVCFFGGGLSVVVGWRRVGPVHERVRAAAWFLLGTLILASYSYCTAVFFQAPVNVGAWANQRLILLTLLPVAATTLVLMLRGWTWSAHDREIAREGASRA